MRKLTIIALISTLTVNSANAGITGALDSMFLSNSTNPTSINTADRNGFMFGGASIHVPVTQINLISFDPPRFNMGCGGIDLYLGSFSFINSQALVALFKQIVANAAAALFYAAIQSISQQLADIMSKFQKIVGDLNNMFRNTCSMGSASLASMSQSASTLAQDVSSSIDSATSLISDFGAGQNASPNQVAQNNSQSNQPFGTSNPALATAPSNPELGNYTWKMFAVTTPETNLTQSMGTSSTAAVVQRELLMTFSGTQVNVPGNTATSTTETTNASSTPSGTIGGTGVTSSPAMYPAILKFGDLLTGSGPSAPQGTLGKALLACKNDSGGTVMPDPNGCQTLDLTRIWDFEGTRSMVQRLLFGTPSNTTSTNSVGMVVPSGQIGTDYTAYQNGIIYLITHCPQANLTAITPNATPQCGMTGAQIAFLQSINAPLQSEIMRLQVLGNQNYGTAGSSLFGRILDALANQYAISLGNSILSAIESGVSGPAVQAAKMPQSVTDSLAELRAGIRTADLKTSSDMMVIDGIQKNLDEMLKNNPNAISVGF